MGMVHKEIERYAEALFQFWVSIEPLSSDYDDIIRAMHNIGYEAALKSVTLTEYTHIVSI
jgi:hypothetical protein